MIAKLLLSSLAAAALSGCMTNGYSYRGGGGDYYYGQPTIEYRHYGYGMPYGGYGFGYSYYGSGYPYGYYDYPYGYYPYGYYDRYYPVSYPDPPPAQPPQPDPDRSDLSSAEAWVNEHGYGQAPAGINRHRSENDQNASSVRQMQAMQSQLQPRVRMTAPGLAQPDTRAVMPRAPASSPRMSPPPMSAPRSYPSHPAVKRASGGGGGSDDTSALSRKRGP